MAQFMIGERERAHLSGRIFSLRSYVVPVRMRRYYALRLMYSTHKRDYRLSVFLQVSRGGSVERGYASSSRKGERTSYPVAAGQNALHSTTAVS